MPADQRQQPSDTLTILAHGEVEIEGRMPWSSNRTFLATATLDGETLPAIYKPHAGERPLWDFPDGLYQREVAAYEVSNALAWDLVPETVARQNGPLGPGSLQRFVEADFEQHYFTLLEDPGRHDALRRIATFDLIANNADRKGGHCLLDGDGHVWAIDHGLCFHVAPKLRTVIWDFSGEPVPSSLVDDLCRSGPSLARAVGGLLSEAECVALARRVRAVTELRRFPDPGEGRPYPWPLV